MARPHTSSSVHPSPGTAVWWPLVGQGPNLGGVRAACIPGQLVQLCDQHQQEVWVEAPYSAHAARHGQHLPKSTSGLQNKRPVQAPVDRRPGEDEASDSGGSTGMGGSVDNLLPRPLWPDSPTPLALLAPVGGGSPLTVLTRSHLPPLPPAGAQPRPSAPTAAAPVPAHSHAGSGSGCAIGQPPP